MTDSSVEWPASRVRNTFLDFFVKHHEHTYYSSSPCVPHDDPTLLFANAGMNQFKPIFLGQVDPASPLAALSRACNSQKCIRAGGKHNDLEDVGKDTYHHTFFEMLGNWSFGDYFKDEAITMAFRLLIDEYGLPSERLYATYFQGDENLGLDADHEAREFWLRYLPADRVLPFGSKENFWEMGDVGPCGPCSELHFDRIGDRDASHLVNADDPDVIEIWNLVFIQYNRESDGSLRPLPNKHVDTGMGFERITSILQNKRSNYDSDVFSPLFAAIQEVYGCREYTGKLGKDDADGIDMAYRVLGDHIRTLSFAIADGAVPSNEGRGYVLRRILRRAVRYGQQFLGGKKGNFSRLVDPLVNQMKVTFPELDRKRETIREIIFDEEVAFGRTLERGIDRFRKVADEVERSGTSIFPGKDAFFLYDSMGFPLDLTQLMAIERNLHVDEKGYFEAMALAKEVSKQDRSARTGLGGKILKIEAEETDYLVKNGVKPTDDADKYRWDQEPIYTIQAIYAGDRRFEDRVQAGEEGIGMILDATSFYAEAGGQVADTGKLESVDGESVFEVIDVQSKGGFVLHIGILEKGCMMVGTQVRARVDYERRSRIAPNHTMTHVLNFALRDTLGTDVDQKGSEVNPLKLRFDFSHSKAVTEEELDRVESICREMVDRQIPVYTSVVPLSAAKKINTLRSVFGEVYPDPVRVVSVGQDVGPMISDPSNPNWMKHAVEFCGGTHLRNTGQAASFVIVEESAVAKGIRRIVALTGEAAVEARLEAERIESRLNTASSLPPVELEKELVSLTALVDGSTVAVGSKSCMRRMIASLSERVRAVQKERSAALAAMLGERLSMLCRSAMESNRLFVVSELSELAEDGKLGSKLLSSSLGQFTDGAILICYFDAQRSRVQALASCSASAIDAGLAADAWVSAAIAPLQGRGGGKPSSAQAQAPCSDHDSIQHVLTHALHYAHSKRPSPS
uniref:Alanine--tRNA ligase n=1 Tax=Compsopogon caeruleus TaxID=31354 RepID=A0A7S1TGB8_9RHOD|mmetsp:Transcript_5992/g.11792  ORF Transcript_5992/g.11792 Transcript_5992/m.11792 type:complete len:967 (+) Transcript_5992:53-2953(+)